ncbi:MAG: class II fumarate hydratase [Bacteroidales bacterium]|nr:class II fumarate hydratase [Bacteroidales bacterium]
MKTRIEHDSLGNVEVPADCYWGAQTQRSKQNFLIGNQTMPLQVIYNIARIKRAAASANAEMGKLSTKKMELIHKVCDEIINGKHDFQFPLSVWQTGSGTQTNMNLNEVISIRGEEIYSGDRNNKPRFIHPNDDVNMSQSSNDVFPTAMRLTGYEQISKHTIPAIRHLRNSLQNFAAKNRSKVKTGRTHLMDATPISFGQEFSAYVSLLDNGLKRLQTSIQALLEIPLGGTAVGTGLNTLKNYDKIVAEHISKITGEKYKAAKNKFEQISAHDAFVDVHNVLNQIAISIHKIANDLRFMSSGPRCGINELQLPANEPGSSIMPGKVNPTQIEAIMMVCARVAGNDVSMTNVAKLGNLELNVAKPLIIFNLLESAQLLGDASISFADKCVAGLKVNIKKTKEYTEQNLMLNTVLNKAIGYEKAAQIAKIAIDKDMSLREAAILSGFITATDYDKLVDVKKMLKPEN